MTRAGVPVKAIRTASTWQMGRRTLPASSGRWRRAASWHSTWS